MTRILVVDDDEGVRTFVADALATEGYVVEQADSGESALAKIREVAYALVITDLKMPGMTGVELLGRVRGEQDEVEFIVLTAHGNVEAAVEAMRLGAFDFVQKPVSSPRQLRVLAARALERRTLKDYRRSAQHKVPGIEELPLSHGAPAMQRVEEALMKVAPTRATVLLSGESGTGKEVTARWIHTHSDRADEPFVAVNCATLSESLLASELFGHEKGAFTGATERKRGRLELADGGTFFLDEIGELKTELQAKLLRVLQERVFERVGGVQTISVDVRIIAATNRDLPAQVSSGAFREDLYHRLAVFPVELPALRERREDIPALARVVLRRISGDLGRAGLGITDAALDRIQTATWRGNIRELANVLERAAILAGDRDIGIEDLWGLEPASRAAVANDAIIPLAELEKQAIAAALEACGGNRKRAAEALGIGLRTLYDKLRKYDVAED